MFAIDANVGVTMSEALAPLPRGRHRLPREEVARVQRNRIFRAMAEVMAEKGYARTSVADVLRVAGVSRETFYEQFSSKEDCFMSVFEDAMDRLARAMTAERDTGDAAPLERLDCALAAYLETLAADPAYARVFLVEVYAAGPRALERRAQLQQGLARAFTAMFGARTRRERFAAEAFVAAIGSLVTTRLVANDVDGLRALHAPVMDLAARVLSA
jgi:AcrR family transcriptional regulator